MIYISSLLNLSQKFVQVSLFSLFTVLLSISNSQVSTFANYGDFGVNPVSSLPTNPVKSSTSSSNSSNSSANPNNLKLSIDDPYICGSGTNGSVIGGTGKKIVKVELFSDSKLIYTVSTVADTDNKWKVDFDYSKIPSGKYTIISTARDEKDLSASFQFTAEVRPKSECTSIVQLSNQINTVLIRTGGFVQNNLPISLMSAISLVGFVIFFKTFGKKRSVYR